LFGCFQEFLSGFLAFLEAKTEKLLEWLPFAFVGTPIQDFTSKEIDDWDWYNVTDNGDY
jgi:hypothetical protein